MSGAPDGQSQQGNPQQYQGQYYPPPGQYGPAGNYAQPQQAPNPNYPQPQYYQLTPVYQGQGPPYYQVVPPQGPPDGNPATPPKKNTCKGACCCTYMDAGMSIAVTIIIYCAIRLPVMIYLLYAIIQTLKSRAYDEDYSFESANNEYYIGDPDEADNSVFIYPITAYCVSITLLLLLVAFSIGLIVTIKRIGRAGLWAPIGLTTVASIDLLFTAVTVCVHAGQIIHLADSDPKNETGSTAQGIWEIIGLLFFSGFYGWGVAGLVHIILFQKKKTKEGQEDIEEPAAAAETTAQVAQV